MPIHTLVNRCSITTMFLAFAMGLWRYRNLKGSLKLLVVMAGIETAMDIIGTLTHYHKPNNHIFFNVYIPIDFLVIILSTRDLVGKAFHWIAGPAFLVFISIFALDLHDRGPNFVAYHAVTVAWVVHLTMFLLVMIRNLRQPPGNFSKGVYLIASGMLLYYSCTIPGFGLFKYLVDHIGAHNISIHHIGVIVNIVRYIACIIGFWYLSQPAKPAPPPVPRPYRRYP